MNKKHYIYVILLIGSILLSACGEQSVKLSEEQRAMVDDVAETVRKKMEKEENEIFVLLSIKYSVPKESIKLLINEYRDQFIVTNIDKTTLDQYSTKHNITKEKLASIILDYRLFAKNLEYRLFTKHRLFTKDNILEE